VGRFDDAMNATGEVPRVLGDITLRYEPSLLIGETTLRRSSVWTSTLAACGLLVITSAFLLILFSQAHLAAGGLLGVGGGLLWASAWSGQHDRRHRRFVANFETNSLRLDFVSSWRMTSKTLNVPFSSVTAVEFLEHDASTRSLCVEFEIKARDSGLHRETLAAFLTEADISGAERLRRTLEKAFGVGVLHE
jgi:hypothetical protein